MLLLAGPGSDVDAAASSQPAARAQKAEGRQLSAASGADCGICGGRCERAGLLSEKVFGESRVYVIRYCETTLRVIGRLGVRGGAQSGSIA